MRFQIFFLLMVLISSASFADMTRLTTDQRRILQQASASHEIFIVSELPASVVSLCVDENGKLAGSGQRWEASDVITDKNLPHNRLIWAVHFQDYYIIHYERGGLAHSYHVILIQFMNKPTILWSGAGERYENYRAFLFALEQNKFDDYRDIDAYSRIEAMNYETTPESILAEITKRGSRIVVNELYGNGRAWDIVLNGIASGNPEWIRVANALHPGSDAGSASMLGVAMFLALETSPKLVLNSFQENVYSLDIVCSSNFLIDYPANEHSLYLIEKRIHALEEVSEPNFMYERDACIAGLQKALADTQRLIEEASIKLSIKAVASQFSVKEPIKIEVLFESIRGTYRIYRHPQFGIGAAVGPDDWLRFEIVPPSGTLVKKYGTNSPGPLRPYKGDHIDVSPDTPYAETISIYPSLYWPEGGNYKLRAVYIYKQEPEWRYGRDLLEMEVKSNWININVRTE